MREHHRLPVEERCAVDVALQLGKETAPQVRVGGRLVGREGAVVQLTRGVAVTRLEPQIADLGQQLRVVRPLLEEPAQERLRGGGEATAL